MSDVVEYQINAMVKLRKYLSLGKKKNIIYILLLLLISYI